MRSTLFIRCSATVLAISTCAQAWAQTPPPAAADATDETEIVVTGLRESLASSRNIKRNAPQVVDSVVAEDIGKLPDLSVAETSARIPGISVERLGGEASRVLVRGLPDFATTYNGREIFTAETRVVALQDFPSSNIAALEVFKTSTADLVEPGLAGLVNVRSRRPFDFDGFQLSGSVWGLHTKQGQAVTPNFNLLVTNRFETGIGEIGILLNASLTDMQYLDSEPSNTDFLADPTINGRVTRFPDIQRLFYRSGNRKRPSGNVAIQWRPSDNLEIYVDGLYQGFRNKIDDRLLAATLFGGTYSNLVYRDGSNLLRSGTVTNPGGELFSFQGGTYNRTDTYQAAVGAKFDSGPFKLTVDVARTDTTFKGSTESVDRILTAPRTIDFDLDTPQFTVRGVDITDVANWRAGGLYEENQRATGKDWQARADATYQVSDDGLLRSLALGVRYTDREAFREFANRFGAVNTPASAYPLVFTNNNPGFRGTDIQPTRVWASPTYDSIRGNVVPLRQFIIANGNGGGFGLPFTTTPITPRRLFDATEQVLAGYAQANFGVGDTLDGYVGIRGVRTKVRVASATNIPGFGDGNEFTDWLPNASVRFRFTPQLQLRLSYAQTRTKPNFADLAPGTIGAPQPDGQGGTFREGNSGNPFLQPFTSENFDASLEWYFSPTGFASVTAFRRDLNGFIQTRQFRFTDPNLGNLRINQPQNTGRGRIEGIEGQLQTFFDFEGLPDFLRSFGIQANYTRLNANTDFFLISPTAPTRERILGVSKWSYNLVGLFERGPLSARLTYFKRGPSRETYQNRGNDLYFENARYPGRLDLSVNVAFHPRATLFADWTNITGKPFEQYFDSARAGAPRAEYVRFLRFEETTYSVGVRFRLD